MDARQILLTLTVLLGSATAGAATIDLTGLGGNGGGYGNTITASDSGISVTLRGYAETGSASPPGSEYNLLQTAEVYGWSTGVGICNRGEGTVSSGCNDSEHEIDTVGNDDLLVMQFNQVVNFEALTVDPYDGPGSDPNDRDLVFWVGNAATLPDLTMSTFATLSMLPGIGAGTLLSASSSYSPFTHSLSGTGNLLLVSGNYLNRSCIGSNTTSNSECEAYKITNVRVSPVPLPAAAWLLGSALAGCGLLRRRPRIAVA